MIMEFLEGGTLADAIAAWKFKEKQVAYIARELLKGIHHLHSNQLVHRDLKSTNVMLSVYGDVKIIDFGLCVDLKEGPHSRMAGSPYWMAPEVISSRLITCAADIWSFGISIKEILNRQKANKEGLSTIQTMFRTVTKGAGPVINTKEWSEPLLDFLDKCLTQDPKLRWTAEKLLQHTFLKVADTETEITKILKVIFLNNALDNQGLFV